MKPKWKDRSRSENISQNNGGRRRRDAERPEAERSPSSQVIYGSLPVLEALRAENRRVDKVWIADGSRENRLSEIIELCRSRSIGWN
ncbi:MAG: RNA methyltransferase substrate-binding domain-containing protein, partial [Pyrinomonadaceae bacterium]